MEDYKTLLYTLRWFTTAGWNKKKVQIQAIENVSKALSLADNEGDISALYSLRWYFVNTWGSDKFNQIEAIGIVSELLEDEPTHIDHDRIPDLNAQVDPEEEALKEFKPEIKKSAIAKDIKVGLAIGHNKFTGARSYEGDDEWTTRREVTLAAQKELAEYGVESKIFIRDRSRGYTSAMAKHGRDMKSYGSKVNLEMHFNAAGPTATGTEIIVVSSKSGNYFKPLCKHFADHYDLKLRGDKGSQVKRNGRGTAFAKLSPYRSGVWEPYFSSNESEHEMFDDKPKEEGVTFAHGLLECLENDYR